MYQQGIFEAKIRSLVDASIQNSLLVETWKMQNMVEKASAYTGYGTL